MQVQCILIKENSILMSNKYNLYKCDQDHFSLDKGKLFRCHAHRCRMFELDQDFSLSRFVDLFAQRKYPKSMVMIKTHDTDYLVPYYVMLHNLKFFLTLIIGSQYIILQYYSTQYICLLGQYRSSSQIYNREAINSLEVKCAIQVARAK